MNTGTIEQDVRTDTCTKHGEFFSSKIPRFEVWTRCPKCSEELEAERERKELEESFKELLSEAGIPAKFSAARFNESMPPKLRTWMTAAIEDKTQGPLVLVGNVGTGKTHSACGALRRIIWEGWPGRYVTASEYGRLIRNTWSRGAEFSESQLLQRFARSSILVLDELGAHRDVDAPMLQDLICTRYDLNLMPRTIVISNLAVGKFSEVIGERAADRIREGATVVAMTGASRRKPAADKAPDMAHQLPPDATLPRPRT